MSSSSVRLIKVSIKRIMELIEPSYPMLQHFSNSFTKQFLLDKAITVYINQKSEFVDNLDIVEAIHELRQELRGVAI